VRVRDVIHTLADGGADPERHVECRDCGSNLAGDVSACPRCGGDIAVYEL